MTCDSDEDRLMIERNSGMNDKVPSGTLMRDAVVIAGVLLVITLGYVLFKKSPKMPVEEAQAATTPPTAGGNMGADLDLPSSYDSLVATGNRFMDADNFAVAAESYRRALAINGGSSDVRTDYGACLHAMGLPDRAIEEFRTVLKADPAHTLAKFNLGVVFYEKNEGDSSRAWLQKYLAEDPTGRASELAKQLLRDIEG
jgi:tetratricopeptide (TPR) repeat protein